MGKALAKGIWKVIKKGGSSKSRSKKGKEVLKKEGQAKKAQKADTQATEKRQASAAKSAGVTRAFKAKEKAVEALEAKIKGPLRFAPKADQAAAKEKLQLLKNSMKDMDEKNYIQRAEGGQLTLKERIAKKKASMQPKAIAAAANKKAVDTKAKVSANRKAAKANEAKIQKPYNDAERKAKEKRQKDGFIKTVKESMPKMKKVAPLSEQMGGKAKYKVVSGDTLSQIAKRNGTTVAALMKANPKIKDANKIGLNQMINLSKNTKASNPYKGMKKSKVAETMRTPTQRAKIINKSYKEDDFDSNYKKGGTVKRKVGGKVKEGPTSKGSKVTGGVKVGGGKAKGGNTYHTFSKDSTSAKDFNKAFAAAKKARKAGDTSMVVDGKKYPVSKAGNFRWNGRQYNSMDAKKYTGGTIKRRTGGRLKGTGKALRGF